jgi:hypothetical protein
MNSTVHFVRAWQRQNERSTEQNHIKKAVSKPVPQPFLQQQCFADEYCATHLWEFFVLQPPGQTLNPRSKQALRGAAFALAVRTSKDRQRNFGVAEDQ